MPDPAQHDKPKTAKAQGGLLPISAAQTAAASNKGAPRGPPQRLKTVVRRLPPGLTQEEFDAAIGQEWKVGQGKVSWAQFRPGKISKDLSKPSRPGRAYFQLSQQAHLEALSDKVKQTSFADARKTDNDPCLIGPPILEFAPYNRIPFGRKRNDARQGLIDQDPEFIQFLESLTNPITKPTPDASDKLEKPKVTPLIEHLRAKKAAKEAAKETKEKASPQKTSKHARQGSKGDPAEATTAAATPKGQTMPAATDKKGAKAAKAEKLTKAAAKPGKKDVQPEVKPVAAKPPQSPKPVVAQPARRPDGPAPVSAAARMIQRDLGLRGGRGAARGRAGRPVPANAATPSDASTTTGSTTATGNFANNTTPTPASPQPGSTEPAGTTSDALTTDTPQSIPTGPAANKAPPTAPKVFNKPAPGTVAPNRPLRPPPSVNPTSTQAFLKHANPSQGITEPLLLEAFAPFGTVKSVEIDKRKGFAYVEFEDSASLLKAIQASPVKVAAGSVQVLERKDRPPPPTGPMAMGRGVAPPMAPRGGPIGGMGFRGGRGSMRGRGGMFRGGPNAFAGPPHVNGVGGMHTPATESASLPVVHAPASDMVSSPPVEVPVQNIQEVNTSPQGGEADGRA